MNAGASLGECEVFSEQSCISVKYYHYILSIVYFALNPRIGRINLTLEAETTRMQDVKRELCMSWFSHWFSVPNSADASLLFEQLL